MPGPNKIPPQIVRLLLLVVAIVGSYLLARFFLTPPSFGEYGWYRGAALAEVAALNPTFAGRKACGECHSDEIEMLSKHEHKTLSCEACHGPAQAHADNPDIKPEKSTYATCLRCHEANPSRPKWHHQIVSKTHYTGSSCTECHIPHSPLETP